MNPSTLIAEAWISLGKNKVRTALSMLGIVIGVGAVITLVAMGQATKMRIEDEIARLGDDWMFIRNFGAQTQGLRVADKESKPQQTKHDANAINEQCPAVRAATPSNRMTLQVRSSFGNYSASVQGVYPNYHDIRRWEVVSGRRMEETDETAKKPVCVMGQTTARELFGSIDPVGEEISVKNSRFTVVGLLESKGQSDGRDNDDVILFPYSTFERRIAGAEVSQTLLAAAAFGVDPKVAEDQIRRLLRERHKLSEEEPDDFRIFALSESAAVKEQSSESFTWLLKMIASVSLIVGGIGIMNIMLVSVTERTREIGLRMAIGASGGEIMMQFLIEAIVLCTLGGIVGMFGGWGFSFFLTSWKGYETAFSYWIAGIALGFAFATGVFFGFYPAWRASRLDPIEALRFE
ncbi:MAG TPA: ABC transporter permease [Phycisphaerae bacterium]|nr:ABC transporter permease [Phycisphaerae bacterium]